LRPEEIRVRGVQPTDANAIDVKVVELEFLGAFCRAHLQPQAEAASPLIADFPANLMRDLRIEPDQRLMVALPPDVLRVFPAADQA
jgi:iron(III) transport system ATP-binding protein